MIKIPPPDWGEMRVSNAARYPFQPWYKRLWRWARGGFKRKQPFPDDPYFHSVVHLAHFDGVQGPVDFKDGPPR